MAKIVVTDQTESAGIVHTTLLFVEYAKDGTALPGKYFNIEGKLAHIDAMVIKFYGKFVEANDPLRGHSLALFTRLYDEMTSPSQARPIDEPGKIPLVYRGSDQSVSRFEEELWGNFWRLADEPGYRDSMGVRVAQGEAVWRDFEKGWVYTLNLESNGGLNILPEKMEGIYQQALNQGPADTASTQPATTHPSPLNQTLARGGLLKSCQRFRGPFRNWAASR